MSEAAQTVTAEGASVADAVNQAANQLGVTPGLVDYKLDLSHFKNSAGRAVGVTTVRIIAWAKDKSEVEALEALEEGRVWLARLIELMGMKADIQAARSRSEENVIELRVSSPDARFLVGRQGTTLHAIQELLDAAMVNAGSSSAWRVDVDGGARDRREDGDRRDGPPRDRDGGRYERRDDRGDRGGRYDRGDRGGDRGDRGGRFDRRDDRGGDRRRTEQDADKLRRLAQRLAEEVVRTGEPTELRRELNSFERRIVHMVVSEMDGVVSESVGDGPTKLVRLVPAPDKRASGEGSSQA